MYVYLSELKFCLGIHALNTGIITRTLKGIVGSIKENVAMIMLLFSESIF